MTSIDGLSYHAHIRSDDGRVCPFPAVTMGSSATPSPSSSPSPAPKRSPTRAHRGHKIGPPPEIVDCFDEIKAEHGVSNEIKLPVPPIADAPLTGVLLPATWAYEDGSRGEPLGLVGLAGSCTSCCWLQVPCHITATRRSERICTMPTQSCARHMHMASPSMSAHVRGACTALLRVSRPLSPLPVKYS